VDFFTDPQGEQHFILQDSYIAGGGKLDCADAGGGGLYKLQR